MLALYIRISKDRSNQASTQVQKDKGYEIASKYDIPKEKVKVYEDKGVSGTLEFEERGGAFQRMIDDIIAGKITMVYAYDISRFERNPMVRLMFKKIRDEYGIREFDKEGEKDNSLEKDLADDLTSVFNSFNVKMRNKKVKESIKLKASQGKGHGTLPLGYKYGKDKLIEIDPEKSKIVKRIFEMSNSGVGSGTIANTFTEEGIRTVRNREFWAANTILDIIKNPMYKGERNFSGGVYECPVIIKPYEWDKVNTNLKNNRKYSEASTIHKYLMPKGIIKCVQCGKNYFGRNQINSNYGYYLCQSRNIKVLNCNNRSLDIEFIESFVWDRLFKNEVIKNKVKTYFTETDPMQESNFVFNHITNGVHQIEKIQAAIDKVIDLVVKGVLGEDDIKSRLEPLKAQKNKAQQELAYWEDAYTTISKDSSEIDFIIDKVSNNKLNGLNFDQKKKLISEYIDAINVNWDYELKVFYLKFDLKYSNDYYQCIVDNKYTSFIDENGIVVLKGNLTARTYKRKEELLHNAWSKLPSRNSPIDIATAGKGFGPGIN